ncbi:thermonuclease family protein [Pyruvatibacter sp.]
MRPANDNLTAEQEFRRTENRKRVDGLLILAIVAVLWLIQLQPLFAANKAPGPFNAQVLSCNDGDTCKMRVPVWLDTYIETKVRIRGIDAPEIRGASDCEVPLAEGALAALQTLLQSGSVTLHDVSHDKYGGRVLATVRAGGIDVAADMIARGHARPYDGGAKDKTPWC